MSEGKLKVIKVDGIPIGWARLQDGSDYVVEEVMLHKNNVAEEPTFSFVTEEPKGQYPLDEPSENGFYALEYLGYIKQPSVMLLKRGESWGIYWDNGDWCSAGKWEKVWEHLDPTLYKVPKYIS